MEFFYTVDMARPPSPEALRPSKTPHNAPLSRAAIRPFRALCALDSEHQQSHRNGELDIRRIVAASTTRPPRQFEQLGLVQR